MTVVRESHVDILIGNGKQVIGRKERMYNLMPELIRNEILADQTKQVCIKGKAVHNPTYGSSACTQSRSLHSGKFPVSGWNPNSMAESNPTVQSWGIRPPPPFCPPPNRWHHSLPAYFASTHMGE